jgi:hypothetical protein
MALQAYSLGRGRLFLKMFVKRMMKGIAVKKDLHHA